MPTCRCGHAGQDPHPCHGNAYACKKPATQRFYNARPAHVAGMQMKLQVDDTWACDDCWNLYRGLVQANQQKG